MTRSAQGLYLVVAVLIAMVVQGAETPTIQLILTPAELALGAGESGRVVAIVQAGDAALTDVQLRPIEIPGLSATLLESGSWTNIEAGGARSVNLVVERNADGGGTGTMPLRLTYTVHPSDASSGDEAASVPDAEAKRGVLVSSLTLTDSTDHMISTMAKLTVKSEIQQIEDRRQGGMAYVEVTNQSSHPMKVTGVRCYAPYFLTVRGGQSEGSKTRLWIVGALSRWWQNIWSDDDNDTDDANDDPMSCVAGLSLPTVEAGSSRVLPFQLTADVVEPGHHTVAWEVEMEWQQAGEMQRGVMVTDKAFNVGVLGESALLKLFAWPSILVLPGALMLLTFLMLRKRVWPKDKSDLSASEQATKAEFWLIAVVLSFLTGILYPWLTGKLGDPRDFMVVHGLDDIVNLWIGSVTVAVLVWALWYGGKLLVNQISAKIQRRREQQSMPQPMDPPLTILDKLQLAGRSDLLVETANVTRNRTTQPALVLFDAGDAGVWVGPPIQVICRDYDAKASLEGLRENVEELPGALRKGKKSGAVRVVKWKREGEMPAGPEKVLEDFQLVLLKSRRRLVELEVTEEL